LSNRRYHSRRTLTRNESKVKRDCLKCGDRFIAKGRFNRICPKCTETNRAYTLTGNYATWAYF
jgi:Zn finger protein HypA/HybF involved in hydrogenase expression